MNLSTTYTLSHEWPAEDLPILVIAQEGLPPNAPLVVALHGLGSSKEKMLSGLYEFARIGCRAVALDARLHGERPDAATRDERLQTNYFATTAEIIEGTAQDVLRLLDHFSEHFGDTPMGIHGISLGGYIAFAALLADSRLQAASVALGSPDWLGPLRRFGLGAGHPAYDRALALNPLDLLPGVLPTRPLLMLHGTQDEVVSVDGVIALEERLRPSYAAEPDRLKLELFPGLGHAYTDTMIQMTVSWFERFLVSEEK